MGMGSPHGTTTDHCRGCFADHSRDCFAVLSPCACRSPRLAAVGPFLFLTCYSFLVLQAGHDQDDSCRRVTPFLRSVDLAEDSAGVEKQQLGTVFTASLLKASLLILTSRPVSSLQGANGRRGNGGRRCRWATELQIGPGPEF
jgi:hypothetical protein